MGGRTTRARSAIVLGAALAAAALVFVWLDVDDRGSPPVSSSTTGTATSPTTRANSTSSTVSPATTSTSVFAPAVVVRRGDPTRWVVALTFDAGSDTGHAVEILETLAASDVPATFGMTGRWAEANPTIVRRMIADGHQLVNHSYDHPSFTGVSTGDPPLSRAQRLDQLARADAAIVAAAGVTSKPWFRPPYGDEDATVRADVALAGYRYELLWTVDSLGWQGDEPTDVVQRCLDRAEPGAIYLLHVGAASTDHLALQRIIDGLTARGYGFVTASALVSS